MLTSLAQGDFVYIRNEGDEKEQLFNEREDPRELSDRAQLEQARSIVQRFREISRRLVSQPRRGPG